MAEDPIPADVQDFIIKNIDSVAYLEALLLLRADAAAAWAAPAVAARLYIAEAEAAAILSRLADVGFAVSDAGTYRYARDTPGDDMVRRLAEIYARNLIPVTNLIHSRSRHIRAFASAFKLRKDT